MGFARQALGTYLIRLLLIPMSAINAVVVARGLGPSGLGVFAAITTFVATAAIFASLGLSPAVTKSTASDPSRAAALLAGARLTGLFTGLAACGALLVLRLAAPEVFGGIAWELLLVAGIALPLNLTASQFQAVLLGLRRVRHYNYMEILDRVLLLAASVTIIVVLGGGVGWLVAGTTLVAAVRLGVYHGVLWPQSRRLRPDMGVLRALGGVSLRAYLATALSFLVLRSDILLINGMLGAESTGVYSVAVQVAELLLMLPAAIGTVLFPRVAASGGPSSAPFTAAVSRHATLAVTIACAAVGASAWWLIGLGFGPPYQDAVVSLWLLLPGVWCLSLELILANDLAGRDYPAFLAGMWLTVLVVNVGLNVLWLPRLGIAGAAASSSVAYALAFGFMVRYWLRRFPDVRPSHLFVLKRDEWRTLRVRVAQAFLPRSEDDRGAKR